MARIRTIKPDFWTDGKIIKLSAFARLLYIGMWNFTLCDHGHVADDAFKLKLQILPMDPVSIDELLAEVMAQGCVTRIVSPEGRTYLHVKRFEDHQKIDPRWKTRCPACAQRDSLIPAETPVSLPEPQRDSPELTLGRDGMGRETTTPSARATPSQDFLTFWAAYPRKVGKQDAIKALVRARRKASLDEILAGVERLKKEVAGKDPNFTPHATTWLNGGRWEDESPHQTVIAGPWDPEYHKRGLEA
jgi:hypothetical protein